MKTLTLLRHAKSGWDEAVPRDFDRPINARGKRGAQIIGQYIRTEKLTFDYVVASPAVRVTETLDHLWDGMGHSLTPNWDRRVYLASCVTLLDIIHEAPDSADTVLMVGHNPGLEDLILMLVPDKTGDELRDRVELKFPTAALAEMQFDVAHWADIKANSGVLVRVMRPRDIDPLLGPERDEH